MRIVFDTNIVLDAWLRRNDYESAVKLVRAVGSEAVEGIVTANTITDIYYIARKRVGDLAARSAVSDVLDLFDVAAVDGEACAEALRLPMSDFEDAVLAACAMAAEADYIVTGDIGFINDPESPVKAMQPKDILELL